MDFKSALALVLPTLFLAQSPELPVEQWIERSLAMESLVVDYELTSMEGELAQVHFSYEAGGECYIKIGDSGAVWIDQETMVMWGGSDEEGSCGSVNLEALTGPSNAWFTELRESVPREAGFVELAQGPRFQIWPSADDQRMEVALQYGSGEGEPLVWLRELLKAEYEVEALEGSYQLSEGETLQIRLDNTYGIPESVWMRTGEDRFQALRLLSMKVDEGVEIPERPADCADVTAQMSLKYWAVVRGMAYLWLWEREREDGVALDGADREQAVTLFFGFHTQSQDVLFEQRLAMELERLDKWVEGIQTWVDGLPEAEKTTERLEELRQHLFGQAKQGLERSATDYLKAIQPADAFLEASEPELDELLAVEREGARMCIEAVMLSPSMEHLVELLDGISG